jgi:hypothetical protein
MEMLYQGEKEGSEYYVEDQNRTEGGFEHEII